MIKNKSTSLYEKSYLLGLFIRVGVCVLLSKDNLSHGNQFLKEQLTLKIHLGPKTLDLLVWTPCPDMKLPLFRPLFAILNRATSTFSTPLSPRTRKGSPNSCVPLTKHCKTVCARLFVKHFK